MLRNDSQNEISAAVEARREYGRQWRAKNKDRVREYNKNYWARVAAQKKREVAADAEKNSV